jgi:PhzF family phenazine biosynthesis protein
LTSVTPRHEPAPPALLAEALAALRWRDEEIDHSLGPARIFAGNWHLLIAAKTSARLAALDYDFERMKSLMLADGLATLQLVWRERPDLYHARDPFAGGGLVEDPATGSGAAALGGYLRDAGHLRAPTDIVILQGETMGRPSRLAVHIPESGGIIVSGNAVPIKDDA